MPVIYEMRGNSAIFAEFGLNLYSGCAVGCRYCPSPWVRRLSWDRWTSGARPRRNILYLTRSRSESLAGQSGRDPGLPRGRSLSIRGVGPADAKALLILEQYHLRVQVATMCGMRSVRDFDILARNHWKYATQIFFRSESLREEWEPGGAPIAERIQAVREAHAAGLYTWVKVSPVAYPAELIDVVESLRADVDAWRVGRPPAGEPPPKPIVGRRLGLVDADTALAYLRRMVEKGLSEKLRTPADMQVWSPDKTDAGKSGESSQDE